MRIGSEVSADFGAYCLQHRDHLRVLLLAEQIDLQVQVISALADFSVVILADQNKRG